MNGVAIDSGERAKFLFQRGIRLWANRKNWALPNQVGAALCFLEAVESMRVVYEEDYSDDKLTGLLKLRKLSDGRTQAAALLVWTTPEDEEESIELMAGVGITGEEAVEDLLDVVEGFAVQTGLMPENEDYYGMFCIEEEQVKYGPN